jgi:hypothetical protein
MDNGLDSYIKTLEENNIDKEILSELSEADYAKLGITGEAMRKMIKLFSKNPPPEPVKEETAVISRQPEIGETALEQRKEDSLDNSPVRRRLIDNGLSEYIEAFAKNKLDTLDLVSKLTESDLSELGITIIGDRKKIKDIFNIRGEQPKDNNVVVMQSVAPNRWPIAISVYLSIIAAIVIGIIIYYAIPWWWRY